MIKNCLTCGKELTEAQRKQNGKYCSRMCAVVATTIKHETVCKGCGKLFVPKAVDRMQYCSRGCRFNWRAKQAKINEPNRMAKEKARRKAHRELMRPIREAARAVREQEIERKRVEAEHERLKALTKVCEECGETFIASKTNVKYCSSLCARRRGDHNKELKRRARLKENGDIDWSVTLAKLIRRDKNTCHICGGRCDAMDRCIDGHGTVICGDRYPSIDHIKAVVNGGTHSWDNVKLAHRWCNSSKRDGDTYETKTGQLALAI